jgi:hypothetical protein
MSYYSDTHPKIEAMQLEMLRRAPVAKKLEMVANLNQAAIEMAFSGLRMRYPNESRARLRRRLADLLLGKELAEKVYGRLPGEGGSDAA